MSGRKIYYKAVTTELTGPHYGGLLYLPGTTHRLGINDPFDADPHGWCTAGLYVASHRRVTARWGQVTIRVELDPGAPLVKTLRTHRPVGVPVGVDSGKYAKYRTTGFRVLGIVGITVYARSDLATVFAKANLLKELNTTLRRHGMQPVTLTGVRLERLRDDAYGLWEVHDPNAVPASGASLANIPPRVEHRFEVTFAADHKVDPSDLYTHLGHLAGVFPGSQRVGYLS